MLDRACQFGFVPLRVTSAASKNCTAGPLQVHGHAYREVATSVVFLLVFTSSDSTTFISLFPRRDCCKELTRGLQIDRTHTMAQAYDSKQVGVFK